MILSTNHYINSSNKTGITIVIRMWISFFYPKVRFWISTLLEGKKYMLSLIISRLWIKFCLKLLCDEKNFPRVFLKIGLLFHFAVYYFTINGVGYRQDLSSACKSDRADFTDWLSFISFNLMQELNPNPETNA